MLVNVKMPTIVGILTFMSRINFILYRVEHEKSYITSGMVLKKSFEEYKDGYHGGHLGYWKGRILAIFNLHVAMIPSTKFLFISVQHMVLELSFEEFQDGCHGGHLGYWKGRILAILNLHVAMIPSTKFRFISVQHMVLELSFEEFQDSCHGGHLGYWKGRILAILNLHVAMIPSTQFQFISVQHMDLDSRNLSSGIREQQRRRPACTSRQTD